MDINSSWATKFGSFICILALISVSPCSGDAKTGDWSVKEGNSTCIKLLAAITATIHCENSTYAIGISGATVSNDSFCRDVSSGDPERIALTWHTAKNVSQNNELHMTFELDAVNKTYKMATAELRLDDGFPVPPDCGLASMIFTGNVRKGPVIPDGQSYMCATEDIEFAVGDENENPFQLTFAAGAQIQAFGTKNEWSTAAHCTADERGSDVVPIIVGAALAGLVVIVLVGYLIGRIRARRQGALFKCTCGNIIPQPIN